tara:strand:+ start:189 stop:431 length:243 start_codon:yes stop_codon:yes gene_type:complete
MLGTAIASILGNIAVQKLSPKEQKIERPPKVNLSGFMARSSKRTGFSPKSKAAVVVGSALTPTSQYNSVLRKMLNITKYT